MVFDYCAGSQRLRQSGTDIKGWRDASDAGVSGDSCTTTCGVSENGQACHRDRLLTYRCTPAMTSQDDFLSRCTPVMHN